MNTNLPAQITPTKMADEDKTATENAPQTGSDEAEESDTGRGPPPIKGWMVWKNVFVTSIAFTINLSDVAFLVIQSSLHKKQGLGVIGVACNYVGRILGSLFLSAPLIRYLGCKRTIWFSIIPQIPYVVAQAFPSFWTLLPMALLAGLFNGPMHVSESTYLTIAGETYSRVKGVDKNTAISRFFTIFNSFLKLSSLTGNAVTSFVLSSDEVSIKHSNESIDYSKYCGVNFCSHVSQGTLSKQERRPSMHSIYIISGVFVTIKLIALVIILVFVDSLEKYRVKEEGGVSKMSGLQVLLVTIKHLRKRKQQLIVWLALWTGVINSFNLGVFPSSFVTCGWGIENVGFVYMAHGFTAAAMSFVNFWLVKYVHRSILLVSAMALNFLILVALFLWTPTPNTVAVYFLWTMIYSVAWSLWYPLQFTSVGLIFKDEKEAAFGNIILWRAVSSAIAFAYDYYLCTDVKIYILLVLNILAVVGYILAEMLHNKSQREISSADQPANEDESS